MAKKAARGRAVHGVLLLDKPSGATSNAVLQQVKRLFQAQKAGHTGSLDPLATGLLPLCFGEATKVSGFLLDADKTYLVEARLGQTTTTADADGEVLLTRPHEHLQTEEICAAIARFLGDILQVPPMYSAIKQQGKPLYALARQGIEVVREPRQVTIYELDVLAVSPQGFGLRVRCSKGTYIRSLVEDIGEALGCGAHVTSLRRVAAGPYQQAAMYTLPDLQALADKGDFAALDALLLPIDTALDSWGSVTLDAAQLANFRHGQAVIAPTNQGMNDDWLRIYSEDRSFIGLGQGHSDGKIYPKRLFL